MACSSAKCEEYLAIDLAHLRRQGLLRPWHAASLRWARGNVVILPLRDGLRLIYRARRNGEWEEVDQHVFYEWTETRFGGRRAWFSCSCCGRRCRVLYGGSRFRCRHCHGLRYSSQYEPAYQRASARADKLKARVASEWGAFDTEEFPTKPRGMHWSTYWRLKERYDELRNAWTEGLIKSLGLFS